MDLIGEFHPPTSRGHQYALTAFCMLTGFTWCIPLKTKTVEEVAKAYLDHIYSLFGGSVKILMDNDDRVQEQTFQGSRHQTGHGILHTFTTIQTTEQWEG